MRYIAAGIAIVLLALGTAGARSAPATPDQFSLVLEHSPTGWSATCEVGCTAAWAASFSCDTACDARVDASGLVTLAESRPIDPRFAFTVERTGDGVLATPLSGTAWSSLSWGCASEPCRARVTDSGVTLLP